MSTKYSKEYLAELQGYPLSIKVALTKQRIREWVHRYGEDGVYISFSGGKDSTVLLHIVREMYPDVPGVFVDTGLEYPEIREFVRSFDNIVWLRPEMNFRKVIETYGYPFISKEVSQCVYSARKYLTETLPQIKSLTDRQTDRQRYKWGYDKVMGLGKYQRVCGVSETKQRQNSGGTHSNDVGNVHNEQRDQDGGEYP